MKRITFFLAMGVGVTSAAGSAAAVSMSVQLACATDYYADCARHDPDSPAVRACMRANGARLSPRCLNALVAAGEVKRAEVAQRSKATSNK
jgi:hypothetical protein